MRDKRKDTEHALLALMAEDPERGFRRLTELYGECVYWHIRRIVVAHDDAQDATQETFIRAFRGLAQYEGRSTLRVWLLRIATNEALRLLSRRRDTLSLDAGYGTDDETALSFDAAADSYVDYTDLEAVRLQRAIHTLPPKQLAVFSLRYYEEMDYEAIAAAVDTTPTSAKASYHTAKEKVTRYLQTHD